jgi:hypothetical protein
VTGALSVNGYAVSNEGTISGGSVSIGNSQFSNSFINGNGGTISGITLSYQAGGRGNGNFTNNGSISETSSLSVSNAQNLANTGLISANSIIFNSNSFLIQAPFPDQV